VDLVPFKTCTYDCIYCQLGRTTDKTIERKEWVPLHDVLAELREKLSSKPDYITLGGSGEPTLFSRIDELIAGIKAMTDVPVAVLTNGSLLWLEDVRRQLKDADLVLPSFDAGDEGTFRRVNRPHEAISFEQVLDGLIEFRQEFRGQYWLEVFALSANTTMPTGLSKIAQCVDRIRPDRVQLNTVTRPPAERSATGVCFERLQELASGFDPPAEAIADYRGVQRQADFAASREEVLEMLRRRPCSVDDIAGGLVMHRNAVLKYVEKLKTENRLVESQVDGVAYYRATSGSLAK
jgi:wyosine [tRNA(Phe)-imidazoG37] synthetase (radical SAM superfamily)